MQSANNSDSSSGEPEIPTGPTQNIPADGFKLTPEDGNILNKFMDEFEWADTQMRNNILEKAMGELYRLRPGNSVFDKKEAKQVCILGMHRCIGLTHMYSRKYESGSTIIIPLLTRRSLVLFGGGLQGMSSIMTRRRALWSWLSKYPEMYLDLRHSWAHSRMQPLSSGRDYPLTNRRNMQRLQRTGRRMHLRIISKPGNRFPIALSTPLI
jgi:hypothetical protein